MLWQWRNGVWILNKVYVIGMGPGAYEQMTVAAVEALKGCDVIVGYTVYVDLMKKYLAKDIFDDYVIIQPEIGVGGSGVGEIEAGQSVEVSCEGIGSFRNPVLRRG